MGNAKAAATQRRSPPLRGIQRDTAGVHRIIQRRLGSLVLRRDFAFIFRADAIGPFCRMPLRAAWHLRVAPRLRVQHPSAREGAREKRTQRLGGTQRQLLGFALEVGMRRLCSPPLIRWLREASSRPLGLRGLWVPPFRRRGWNAEIARNAEATSWHRGGGWFSGREDKMVRMIGPFCRMPRSVA